MNDEIKVHCTDKGQDVLGHILNYKPGLFLEIAINTVKIKFQYHAQFEQYVGNMAGLEWVVKETDLPNRYSEYTR